MTRPQDVLRWSSRVILALAALGLGYLFWRFDRVSLASEACSPLWEVPVGSSLVFDVHPPRIAPGDVVLFRAPDGSARLARVESVVEDAFVLVTDRDDCPSPDSSELGPVGRERVLARLVLTLPF